MPDNIIDTLNLQINGESSRAISAVTEIINKLDNLKNKVGELNKIKVSLGIGPKTSVNLKAFGEAIDGLNIEKFRQFAEATGLVTKMSFGITKDTGDNLSMFAMALDDLDVGKMFEFGAATNTIAKVSLGMSDKTGEYLSSFATALNTLDLEKLREFSSINEMFTNVRTGITNKTNEHILSFATAINGINVDKLIQISNIDFSNLKPLAEAGKYIENFTSHVNQLSIVSAKAVKSQQSLANATNKVAKTARTSGHSFSFANTMVGKFLATVKRIAIHRLIRNMLRSITQGFSEGIENLYYWSQAVGTNFAPRMDQLATSMQYLKNGFASMFSPLIERAIPILDVLIDKVVDVFNVVQELFARLTGQATWNRALKYPVTYKDQLDDATKSAKALQNVLMDFDEINAINSPKAGSSGSAADAKDYSAMFELMETSTSGSPLAKFRDLFEDIGGKVERIIGIGQRFWGFFKSLNFAPMEESLSRLWDILSPIIDELIGDADWFREKVIQPITQFLVEKGIPAAIDTIAIAIDNLWKFFKPFRDGVKTFWDQNGEWILKMLGDQALLAFEKIQDFFKAIGAFAAKNGTKIREVFGAFSNFASKISPIVKVIDKMVGTHAWDTFVQSIRDIFTALEPILTLLDGIFTTLDGIASWDETKMMYGIGRIGESILQLLLAPLKLVLGAFATFLDTLAVVVEKVDKDAAQKMRNFADILRGTDEQTEKLNEAMSNLNATWYEMDEVSNVFHNNLEARGEMVDFITKINDANSSMNLSVDTIESLVGSIQQVGPKSKEEFEILQFWTDWCTKYGVNPLRTGVGNVNKELGGTGGVAKAAAKELSDQFASALSPTAGFNLGKSFGDQIQQGINNRGSVTIPITAQFTNANYNQLVQMTRAALGGMGLSIQGFATGGFPTPGTLFTAGEIPGQTELLGTIGGRTAVAGGEEITGIREAIYEQGQREENLLRTLISAVNAKDLNLVANATTGRWVNKSLKAYAGVTG